MGGNPVVERDVHVKRRLLAPCLCVCVRIVNRVML